jgi:hypothetical protein
MTLEWVEGDAHSPGFGSGPPIDQFYFARPYFDRLYLARFCFDQF